MASKKYDKEVLNSIIKPISSKRNRKQPYSVVSLALRGKNRPRNDKDLFLNDLSDKEIYESYSKDAEELNQYLDNIINSKGKRKKTRRKNKKGKKTRRKNKKGKKTRRRRR